MKNKLYLKITKIILGLLALLIASCIYFSNHVSAQTPTKINTTISPTNKLTPTPTNTIQDSQIEKIKDLVASRVAELKLVDKRGFLGYVKSSSNTQITLTKTSGEQLMVDIDELTKFDGGSNESFGISDIENGDLLSIVGLYNKQTERMLARFTKITSSIPQNIEGVVTLKDISEFTLTIVTADGKERLVNVESSTKSTLYDGKDTIKSGFTKITAGQRIIIIGFQDKTNKEQINAARIIHFPDFPLSEELKKGLEKAKTKKN